MSDVVLDEQLLQEEPGPGFRRMGTSWAWGRRVSGSGGDAGIYDIQEFSITQTRLWKGAGQNSRRNGNMLGYHVQRKHLGR